MEIEQIWFNTETQLRQYLQKQVKDYSVVDDLLQNIFIKMKMQLHQLKDMDKAGAWLFQIARHTLMDYFRKEKKVQITNQQGSPSFQLEVIDNSIHEDLANWLVGAIELLPDTYREAVYLSEIQGMSQKDLAVHLGISYSGAKSRVQRGKIKLKEIILACCDVAADHYGNVIEVKRKPQACNNC